MASEKQLDIPHLTRQIVYDRDGNSCRVCGSTTKLEIHHIVPRGMGRNHDLCNLILLCAICHDLVEAGKLPHWHHNEEITLFHISPVKAYMHTFDFSTIICSTHQMPLSLIKHQPPIRAYAITGSNPIL